MSHPWKSKGDKRTITYKYAPSQIIITYLENMQNAIRYALMIAYTMTISNNQQIPSPIDLRSEIKEWFNDNYKYAKHHINPVCRAAIAMLRSYRKNNHELRIPEVKKLAMRIDSELFKIIDDKIRITIEPNKYEYIPINNKNKNFEKYSNGTPSELLITNKIVCITYIIAKEQKQ